MDVNEWLRLVAGSFILASLILGILHNPYWFFFTGFVALNLMQSAVSRWCPMMMIPRKLGIKD